MRLSVDLIKFSELFVKLSLEKFYATIGIGVELLMWLWEYFIKLSKLLKGLSERTLDVEVISLTIFMVSRYFDEVTKTFDVVIS